LKFKPTKAHINVGFRIFQETTMHFIEDLREAGIIDLTCDCGAHFGNADGALENALRHVSVWHCTDVQRQSRRLLLGRIALFLSPTILLDGGGQCQEISKA
jgi:hypothetical protein